MQQTTKAILFDLGGVLIDWNPEYLFTTIFDDKEEMKSFLTTICTSDWNEEQDAGRSTAEATKELVQQYPQHQAAIEAYYSRWPEMLGGAIEETVEILRQLKEHGKYTLYALTNWSAETFPIAQQRYPFLQWFANIVVSGVEKMRKPTPGFYQLFLDRHHLQPGEVLFIDDNLRNIQAAALLGMQVLHYTTSNALWTTLHHRNILS